MNFSTQQTFRQPVPCEVGYVSALNDVQFAYESLRVAAGELASVDKVLSDVHRACALVNRTDNLTETLQMLDMDGELTSALQKDIKALSKDAALESLTDLAKEALKKFIAGCIKVWEFLVTYFKKLRDVFSSRKAENKEFVEEVKEAQNDKEHWDRFGQSVPGEMNQGATEAFNYFGYLTKELMPADDTIQCLKEMNEYSDKLFTYTEEWANDSVKMLMVNFEKFGTETDPAKIQAIIDEFDRLWKNYCDDFVYECKRASNRFFRYEFNPDNGQISSTVVYAPRTRSMTIMELGWGVKGKIEKFVDEYTMFMANAEARHKNIQRVSNLLRETSAKVLREMDSIQNAAQSKQIQLTLRMLNTVNSFVVAHDIQCDKVFKKHRTMLDRCLQQSK